MKTMERNEIQTAKEKAIAQTIIAQIKASDRWALSAYGAREFVILSQDDKINGGVMFRVNGINVKGKVRIELKYNDTYTIKFYKIRRKKGEYVPTVTLLKEFDDVYCDQLVQILDYIEKKES